jgi:xanthine dehydrogenase accessory factor
VTLSKHLSYLLAQPQPVVLAEITQAEGSTPREAGALMLISAGQSFGTIGGGQLEFHAIDVARDMIAEDEAHREITLHLGPHLGQCCGGRVMLHLKRAGAADVQSLAVLEQAETQGRPQIAIFGAGHTGLALCRQLALLPFKVHLIDDRPDVFGTVPAGIETVHLDQPVHWVASAPARTAYIILSHSHALDYALAEAALKKGDAAYVGMIGSATKRARFASWFLASGGTEAQLSRLICPIGGKIADKRPEMIAALTIAEVIGVFTG